VQAIKLENPHLFVTLPPAEAVYTSVSARFERSGARFPRAPGKTIKKQH
jgi:hypothetical protein